MTATLTEAAKADFPDEVVTNALVQDITLPHGAGVLAARADCANARVGNTARASRNAGRIGTPRYGNQRRGSRHDASSMRRTKLSNIAAVAPQMRCPAYQNS